MAETQRHRLFPSNLQVSNVTENSFDLNWDTATDNEGVDQYVVYLDGNLFATTTNTSITVSELAPSTNYTASVSAKRCRWE